MKNSTLIVLGVATFMTVLLAFAAVSQETTGGEYRQHILYCDTSEDAIKLVDYLMKEDYQLAREMLVFQGSSCHATIDEGRPPLRARNHEEIYSRFALGHTFTVERATTASGRDIYVMEAIQGE